jgi:tRNA-intron endonuclease
MAQKQRIIVEDQSTKDILKKGFFGKDAPDGLELSIEEALYLIDVRNASCTKGKNELTFNDLAERFWKKNKFIARYFTYKDWRDRGLVIKDLSFRLKEPNTTSNKEYPSGKLELPPYKIRGIFFKTDLISIIDDKEKGKELYDTLWFGQYGSYKASDRGQLNKMDLFETLFLIEKGMLTLTNISKKDLLTHLLSKRKDAPKLFEVYKDWRERGYVIKTGFKFGTHFRVYFPGAHPIKNNVNDWIHSKHVIHVFPKDSRLLISEWARAIRVAHSVRKTFILAVPGKTKEKKTNIDYVLYHRKGGEAETPLTGPPKYVMLSLSEDEYIGGNEFAGAITEAKKRKAELILAIADRETSVTYYKVRQIRLPSSDNDYYEIDWLQP